MRIRFCIRTAVKPSTSAKLLLLASLKSDQIDIIYIPEVEQTLERTVSGLY
jgi:hypothetical protein